MMEKLVQDKLPTTPAGGTTLLFVDDEPGVLRAFELCFSRTPYRTLFAQSAQEALEILTREPVDVVVSDERMPGIPGCEFLERVRALYPRTKRVLLTGYATPECMARAANAAQVHCFLTKPCRYREMSAALAELLAAPASDSP